MTKKILHIAGCDKFIPPFIKLVKEEFNFSEHEFLLTSGIGDNDLLDVNNITLLKGKLYTKLAYYFAMTVKMHKADKIILHSLFNMSVVKILFFSPWLLKKCYWIMWGGDLYVHKIGVRNKQWKKNEFFRKFVIKNMGYLVTYIKGDLSLAQKWYGAKGKYVECLMYPSNLYKKYDVKENKTNVLNIQVGNSANPTNNHIDALKKLLPYKDGNICIYVPLSYGCKENANQVIKQGKEWFGDKFKPLTKFMAFEDYLVFLGSIDIAIFNHERQQAMGNTITLLGLGKTVYIRSDTTQWDFFKEKGINIKDVEQFNSLDCLKEEKNIEVVKEYFSKSNYLDQLKSLFEK